MENDLGLKVISYIDLNIACMIEDKSDTSRLNRLSYKIILQNQKKNFQNKEFSSDGVVDYVCNLIFL